MAHRSYLAELVKLLRTRVDIRRFTLHDWVSWLPRRGYPTVANRPVDLFADPGYAGDPIAWLACVEEVRLRGLSLGVGNGVVYEPIPGKIVKGWRAVECYLRLSGDQARHLFHVDEYTTDPVPRVVASRIAAFMETS